MSTAWENKITPKLEVVFPRQESFNWDNFIRQRPLPPFSTEVVAMCEAFSKCLLSDPRCRSFPDLTALGFWFRSARIRKMHEDFHRPQNVASIGRGLTFHLAPGNVDTIFIYSLFHGLLAGNFNVVRLGRKTTPQQELLLNLLIQTLEKFPEVAGQILLVRYPHDDEINAFFSAVCHVRVIWGGDDTINHIRKIPIPAASCELTFSGKFSFAVFDAAQWLAAKNPERHIPSFLTDAFSFGQQGCSSPKLICWLGNDESIQKAQETFWSAVDAELIRHPHEPSPAEAMERYLAVNATAAESTDPIRFSTGEDKKSYCRLELKAWTDIHRELNTGNGLFFELRVRTLAEILEHCEENDQTILSFGVSRQSWQDAILQSPPRGICRIVPFGKALEFNSIWDGTDLLEAMSKKILICGE